MMDDGGGNDVFIYMGGDQVVPQHVTHAIVDPSVDNIRRKAFRNCRHPNLVSIKMHDGVKIIEVGAFYKCRSLREIKLAGVRVIESSAFCGCEALEDVKFGNQLDTIGNGAFYLCISLCNIKIPKVRIIGNRAFCACRELTEAELSEDLEKIGRGAFAYCPLLERIALPLKRVIFDDDVFKGCDALSQVDLVGGIHKTISSLHLESWRDEMKEEIGRINQVLPNTVTKTKTVAIKNWLQLVTQRIEHYKSEHYALLKDNVTQLELALWKAKLYVEEANLPNVDAAASRQEARVTCGANIIIPHVLSFLNDHDAFPLLRYDVATLRDWINS